MFLTRHCDSMHWFALAGAQSETDSTPLYGLGLRDPGRLIETANAPILGIDTNGVLQYEVYRQCRIVWHCMLWYSIL